MSTTTQEKRLDVKDIKQAARNRWPEVLSQVAGIPAESLDGKHHPCPKCGGSDRFRLMHEEDGAIHCNQCNKKCGDGVAAVQWALGCTFPEALAKIAGHVGVYASEQPSVSKPKKEVKTFPTLEAAIADVESWDGKHSAQWHYHDATGELVGAAVRWDYGPDDKAVKPFAKLPGGWANCAMPAPRPLYHLPELLEADVVIVTEGEKAAEAARSLGYVSTASSGGSAAAKKTDWSPLAGKDVVILPDHDAPGESYLSDVIEQLSRLSPRPTVKVVRLPELPEKGDCFDWIAANSDKPVEELWLRLQQMIAEASPIELPAATEKDIEPRRKIDYLPADGEVVIANYSIIEIEDKEPLIPVAEGEEKPKRKVRVAKSMSDIIDQISEVTCGWPRRVDNVPFIDDPKYGIGFLDRGGAAALFGWLRRNSKVDWVKGTKYVTQTELLAEIQRTSHKYDGVEILPHEPMIPNIYYQSSTPEPGDGSHLRELLDRFRPETTIDRDLIQAAFMTTFWGGPTGSRPCFVITSDTGRGAGKTKLAECIGYLAGGHLDVSMGESIEIMKQRLLSSAAATIRVGILDNVKTMKLSWAELEGLITTPIISGKRMYVGEGQRPNHLTWVLTLNGVSLATDMAQRAVIIKLTRGENSGVWYEETLRFIEQHRRDIIGDIVAALRAEEFQLAKFSRWASWERHVLSRLPEPNEAQRVILDRQGECNAEFDEAEIIEDYFASQLQKLGYYPLRDQIRIPVEIVARWYCIATNDKVKTPSVTRHLSQMANEGQLQRLSKDTSRTYGRCFIWTGINADTFRDPIRSDINDKIRDIT